MTIRSPRYFPPKSIGAAPSPHPFPGRIIRADPGQRALAVVMAGFAREIGATLIAEGIETAAVLETLESLGVQAGQGYLLGWPSTQPEDWACWPVK